MLHPEVFYAVALSLFLLTEAGFRVRGIVAFGPMTWVLGAVFAASYAALFTGIHLPTAQLCIHLYAFIIGFAVARGAVGHLCAGLFLPMAMIGALAVANQISPVTWWWGLFYMACAQLVMLGMGSNLHPLGRWIRRVTGNAYQYFNRLVGAR